MWGIYPLPVLTHWGRVTYICVSELTIIGSDNGLSPGWRQAIIWNNAGLLLIEPLGTNFSEILIGIQTFSFKKMHLNMSSAKWRTVCLGLNVLTAQKPESVSMSWRHHHQDHLPFSPGFILASTTSLAKSSISLSRLLSVTVSAERWVPVVADTDSCGMANFSSMIESCAIEIRWSFLYEIHVVQRCQSHKRQLDLQTGAHQIVTKSGTYSPSRYAPKCWAWPQILAFSICSHIGIFIRGLDFCNDFSYRIAIQHIIDLNNGGHFADEILFNENLCILIQISLKLRLSQVDNKTDISSTGNDFTSFMWTNDGLVYWRI